MTPVRLLVSVVMAVTLWGCGSNGENSSPKRTEPASPSTEAVRLTISGDEYEYLANPVPLPGTLGTECPPSHGVASVPAECWTWDLEGLGAGTYTQVFQAFTPDNIAFTFTLADSGGTITGTGTGHLESEDATGGQELGHVRRFPHTMTLTSGTGSFTGIRAKLTGEFTSTVVTVDPATGIVHRKVAGTFTGTLRSSPA
jgi:hypothetical protein